MAKSNYTTERWKPVVGYEGLYEISDKGRVKSLERTVTRSDGKTRSLNERIMKPRTNPGGYHQVDLYEDGERMTRPVHQLVLEAFVGPRPEGMVCCHANDVPDDNRVENLRWDTYFENMRDMVRHGNANNGRRARTACPRGHALSELNNVPSKAAIGRRKCLSCDRTRAYIRGNPEFKPWFDGISDRVYREIVGGTYARGYTEEAAAEAVVSSIITEAVTQIIDPDA